VFVYGKHRKYFCINFPERLPDERTRHRIPLSPGLSEAFDDSSTIRRQTERALHSSPPPRSMSTDAPIRPIIKIEGLALALTLTRKKGCARACAALNRPVRQGPERGPRDSSLRRKQTARSSVARKSGRVWPGKRRLADGFSRRVRSVKCCYIPANSSDNPRRSLLPCLPFIPFFPRRAHPIACDLNAPRSRRRSIPKTVSHF